MDADGDAEYGLLDEAVAVAADTKNAVATALRADDVESPRDACDGDVAWNVYDCDRDLLCDDADPESRTRCLTSYYAAPTRYPPNPERSLITTCYSSEEAPSRRTLYLDL